MAKGEPPSMWHYANNQTYLRRTQTVRKTKRETRHKPPYWNKSRCKPRQRNKHRRIFQKKKNTNIEPIIKKTNNIVMYINK